jgi:hypothetical protein
MDDVAEYIFAIVREKEVFLAKADHRHHKLVAEKRVLAFLGPLRYDLEYVCKGLPETAL